MNTLLVSFRFLPKSVLVRVHNYYSVLLLDLILMRMMMIQLMIVYDYLDDVDEHLNSERFYLNHRI